MSNSYQYQYEYTYDFHFRVLYSCFIYSLLLYMKYSDLIYSEHLKILTIYIMLTQYMYNTYPFIEKKNN